jgi:putative ABC transport system permease protein
VPTGAAALIAAGTVAAVAAATVAQAWLASRVSPVDACTASPPRGRLSRLARVSLVVRLPTPLVLGARDAFARRWLAAGTIAGVALPMALITVALACWATIDGFTADPARISLPATLTAYLGRGETPGLDTGQLAADPQVRAFYPGAESQVPLPGRADTFTARAMGTVKVPYPLRVTLGRMFRAADEAVASQQLLAAEGEQVGSRMWVTVNGVPTVFHIVGQVIDPADAGLVLDFPIDALGGPDAAAQFYSLVLAPGADPARVSASLRASSGGLLDVRPTPNPASTLGLARVVIVISVILLAVVAVANLVTVTRASLRDHAPEAGVLAAVGLTPAEVTATYAVSAALLTALGVTLGTIAGLAAAHPLINAQAATIGLGWGVEPYIPAPLTLLAAMAIAILAGTATALVITGRPRGAEHGPDPVLP